MSDDSIFACYYTYVYTPETVTAAIAVHGCQLSNNGRITRALKVRLDTAVRLYRKGKASVIIVCGFHPLKREDLAKYCEADAMEEYILRKYGDSIPVLKERFSTSVPENLVFVRLHFPKLTTIHIVVGKNVVERIKYFGYMVFTGNCEVTYWGCNDGIGDVTLERRLIRDARCTLKHMKPGDWRYLLDTPDSRGNPRSHWNAMRLAHHHCPIHPRPETA